LDFERMIQRNTSSGKERPIHRGIPALALRARASVSSSLPFGRHSCTLSYTAQESLHSNDVDEKEIFVNVTDPSDRKHKAKHQKDEEKKKEQDVNDDDECAICLDSLWNPHSRCVSADRVVAIKICEHRFHYQCIHDALTKGCGGKCPLCLTSVTKQEGASAPTSKGKSPSATMSVNVHRGKACAGYEAYDLLEISYCIPSGTQKKYHPAPNLPFSGSDRSAYLPDNSQGRDLLVRMQYAFMHGLTFMIGTSLTTGRANTVTWASIHHKTSYCGGVYGFPDASYFDRSNEELNHLGVPDHDGCRAWLLRECPGYL